MPANLTYPGVYIEELASGVRTITGASTSVTAFVGRAARGTVNEAVTINSFSDFEKKFGGLWTDSTMSYAVRDFYLNGGSQAHIVRVFAPAASKTELNSTATVAIKSGTGTTATTLFNLTAKSAGAWGNKLSYTIDQDNLSSDDTTAGNFNLTIIDSDKDIGSEEKFLNVSTKKGGKRLVDTIVNLESKLVTVSGLTAQTGTSIKTPTLSTKKDGKYTAIALTGGAEDAALTDTVVTGSQSKKTGLYALEKVDNINLLCIPPYSSSTDVGTTVLTAAAKYCESRRAFLIIDPPKGWTDKTTAVAGGKNFGTSLGTSSKNAAVFFPRIKQANPLNDNKLETFAPCGMIAGTMARTDAQRGIWKAAAGLDATLSGVSQLGVSLTDSENGELNGLGVNALRTMPAAGSVIWGARTLQGNDTLASEWKYIPVRRLALYIEESLYRGTQWVVFEPNDEPLWQQIRINLGAFMGTLFRQGAFQGNTPDKAYFVKCDSETTTQDDINRGIVNIIVGFAPLKPAEFVVIKLQQIANQS